MGCSSCGKGNTRPRPVIQQFISPSRDSAFQVMRDNIESGKYKEDMGQFGTDLINAFKLTDHPKAEKAYIMAWNKGHANGLYEVLLVFSELTELLL